MGSRYKEYTLDDGSVWTIETAAERLGCHKSSAYARLNNSTDPDRVFRPINKEKCGYGYKLYTLDDGTKWTASMVAEHSGVTRGTASTRLSCYTDPEKVLCPPKNKQADKTPVNAAKQRMYYDPLGHWALINKHIGVNK